MRYELLTENEAGVKIYAGIDKDGLCRVTCTQDDAGYQAWLNPKAEHFTPSVTNEAKTK